MKKRIMLTLEVEPYKELQALLKKLRLPSTMIGYYCDETIKASLSMLKEAEAKGSFSLTDLFTFIGQKIEEVAAEEKQEAKPDAKKRKKTVPKRSGN